MDETGSTNADLMEEARRGGPHGVVLVAGHQSAGRGRLGRSWHAEPGAALLMSALVRPQLRPDQAPRVSTALGVAAAEACASLVGAPVALKWPNDVVVSEGPAAGKLGGLLAESLIARSPTEGQGLEAVVVGLGLNVAWPLDLPPDVEPIATSLSRVAGHAVDIEDALAAILERFDIRYSQAVAPDDSPSGWVELYASYRELCGTIGAPVAVELPGERFEGVAVDVTDEGHLVVELGSGERREVTAGDVVHLRGR